MMTNCIPKGCLNELQKIQRAFIWGDENGNRKYHAVSWDKVTKNVATKNLLFETYQNKVNQYIKNFLIT
jgi:hypothetical protein